uniref:Ig-like domain-containing protein n=1 Tax=uncultured Croceitalea sp. TaxID=1798908 RepID=UPI0033056357
MKTQNLRLFLLLVLCTCNFWQNSAQSGTLIYSGQDAFNVPRATYTNSYPVSGTFPYALNFSNDGLRVFMMRGNNGTIVQYDLATPYAISQTTFSGSWSLGSSLTEFEFSLDGTTLFVSSTSGFNDRVRVFPLSTPFDIGTVGSQQSNTGFADISSLRDLTFSQNGLKLFLLGSSGSEKGVAEYDLPSPYDVRNRIFIQRMSLPNNFTPQGIKFDIQGIRLFVSGSTISFGSGDNAVITYDLSLPYQLSSATRDILLDLDINLNTSNLSGFDISKSGDALFIFHPQAKEIDRYDMALDDYNEDITSDNGTLVNDGSPMVIFLYENTFQDTDNDDILDIGTEVIMPNVPIGLTPQITLSNNDTRATLNFTGMAPDHKDIHDVNNIQFSFTNSAFVNGTAAQVVNSGSIVPYNSDIGINFSSIGTGTNGSFIYPVGEFARIEGGDTQVVQVQLRDESGTNLNTPDVSVTFSVSGSAVISGSANVVTNAQGIASIVISNTVQETVDITATVNHDNILTTPEIAVVNGSPAQVTFISGGVAPGGIFNSLSLWLKANDGVFTDRNNTEAGTVLASDGELAQSWKDFSGVRTNDATSIDPTSNGTLYRDDATQNVNFNPVLSFTNTGQNTLTLGNDYIYAHKEGLSLIVVSSPRSTVSRTILGFGTKSETRYSLIQGRLSTTLETPTGSGGKPYTVTTPAISDPFAPESNPFITSGIIDFESDQSIYIQGKKSGEEPITLSQITSNEIDEGPLKSTSSGPFTIGGFSNESNIINYSGTISEIIVYNDDIDAISSTARQQIESYLALKYGITLDGSVNNYLNASGASIFDLDDGANGGIADDGTADWYDVFGIGNETAQALDQQISKSGNEGSILTLSTDTNFTDTNGSHTSLLDGQFLVIGNNGAPATLQTTEMDISRYRDRVSREWKVANTGNVTNANLKFDGYGDDYVLLSSTTGDFSSGNTELGRLSSTGEIMGVALGDATFFTLAFKIEVGIEFELATASDLEDDGGNLPNLLIEGTLPVDTAIDILVNNAGTATIGTDYTLGGATGTLPQTISVIIPAGVYTATNPISMGSLALADGVTPINFSILPDLFIENDETINITLSNPSGALVLKEVADGTFIDTHTYTISNDDIPEFYIYKLTDGIERNIGVTTNVGFNVSIRGGLSNDSGSPITGDISFSGTATEGTDYNTGPTSFSIASAGAFGGGIGASISIPVIEDLLIEGNETVIATISNVSIGSIDINTANAIIRDDDVISVHTTGSFIRSNDESAIANGLDTEAITVQLRNAVGNNLPISGVQVTFQVTGNAVLSSNTALTDINGQAIITITNTVAETVDVTATIDDDNDGGTTPEVAVVRGSPAEVNFVPGVPDPTNTNTTITATSPVTADGIATSTITVQLADTNGNPLTSSGGTVVLSSTGSAIISAVTDNNDGTYTATATNLVAETVTITGTLDGTD